MRVAMLTVGSRGDVQPLVAFGVGLRAAGHAVRVCTHPSFATLVRDQGLAFAPLAEGALSRGARTDQGRRWAERDAGRMPTWVGLLRDARSVAGRRLRDAAAGCEGADVVIATNLTQILGWQVARHAGIPLVRAPLHAPAYWMARRRSPPTAAALRQAAWLAARPWLTGVRRRATGWGGLPLREPLGTLDRDGALVLHPFSPALFDPPPGWGPNAHVTGAWLLDAAVDPDPPPALRRFLDAGPPPVYAGFGTQLDPDPPATTALLVDALRAGGRRGVLQRPPDALAGIDLGADVIAVERVDHAWLFARCAAVVHHAAAGTTATALRAGAPSVCVPHNADQFTWARRLAQLGASPPPLARRRMAVAPLADRIAAACDDERLRARTGALAARTRAEDGVGRAVDALERHLRARAPRATRSATPREEHPCRTAEHTTVS